MNWKIILGLSLFGILMGVLNVFGLAGDLEWLFWLIIALISALVIERSAPKLHVTSGFLVGFLDALFNGIITAIFWERYLLENPDYADRLIQMPEALSPGMFMIIISVLVGFLYGLFIGLVVFLIRKTKKRSAASNN